jgi:WD40 repeat protein/serine/threonine protein kinase
MSTASVSLREDQWRRWEELVELLRCESVANHQARLEVFRQNGEDSAVISALEFWGRLQAEPAVWQVGDEVAELYKVKGVLGEGGMGTVYLVNHRGWNLDLAVKALRHDRLQAPGAVDSFKREAETWVNLRLHPHTVTCFYVRQLGGVSRIFAEYVDGGSLRDWIKNGLLYQGSCETIQERLLDIAIQFAWGLHGAHEQKLIHGDVKPANVMMTRQGVAKVTDFSFGVMTPAYRSPEQAKGQPLSRQSDIWSWAVSILEMFAGKVFWESGEKAIEALESFLAGGQPRSRRTGIWSWVASLREMFTGKGPRWSRKEVGNTQESRPVDGQTLPWPTMPQELVVLLRRCFRKKPSGRPRDMREVVAVLRRVYQDVTGREYARPEPQPAEGLADTLNNQAVSLLDLGRQEEAERLWEESLRIEQHHPESTYNYGLHRWRAGRLTDDTLLQRMREVVASHEGQWVPLYLLAWVHLERGDCDAALAALPQIPAEAADLDEVRAARELAWQKRPESRRLIATWEGHGAYVTSVGFFPDGRRAASCGKDHTVKVWDVATGSHQTLQGHRDEVQSVFVSRDGRSVVTASGELNQPGQVKLWDAATGDCRRTFNGHRSVVYSACLSGDGRTLVSGCSGEVKLWDALTGRHRATLAPDNLGSVYSVGLSPDGEYAVSAGDSLRLWKLETAECVLEFEKPHGDIYSVAVSPDGLRLLTGGTDGVLRVWGLATSKCERELTGHTDRVKSVCWLSEGTQILSAGYDCTVRVWDAATGRCLRTFEGDSGYVCAVAASPDGRSAFSGGWDSRVHHWWLDWSMVAPSAVCRVVASEQAAIARAEFDALLERSRKALKVGDEPAAACHVRAARARPGFGRLPEAVELWGGLYTRLPRTRLDTGWEVATLESPAGKVRGVALDRDGRLALSCGDSNESVSVWDLARQQCVRVLGDNSKDTKIVSFTANGRQALTANSSKGKLLLWDVTTGRELREAGNHEDNVHSLCQSADGRVTLSASSHELRLWEGTSGRLIRSLRGSPDMRAATLSTDGRYVLTGEYDKVCLWDTKSGRPYRGFSGGHRFWVNSVAISPDGRRGLSGSTDNTTKLWDLDTGRCLQTFEGHADGVTEVAFTADGRFVVSASKDTTVKIWDTTTRECVRTFEGHGYAVTTFAMSPDSRILLSGGEDDTLRLWFLDWELAEDLPRDWHNAIRPYLEVFLAGCVGERLQWSTEDFDRLLFTLGCVGYGRLRPNVVRQELERLAQGWKGPPVCGLAEARPSGSAPAIPFAGGAEQMAAILNMASSGDVQQLARFLEQATPEDVQDAVKRLNTGAVPDALAKPPPASSGPAPEGGAEAFAHLLKQMGPDGPERLAAMFNDMRSEPPAAPRTADETSAVNVLLQLTFLSEERAAVVRIEDYKSAQRIKKQIQELEAANPSCMSENAVRLRSIFRRLVHLHCVARPVIRQVASTIGGIDSLAEIDRVSHCLQFVEDELGALNEWDFRRLCQELREVEDPEELLERLGIDRDATQQSVELGAASWRSYASALQDDKQKVLYCLANRHIQVFPTKEDVFQIAEALDDIGLDSEASDLRDRFTSSS